jgi:hypothetical protein
MTHGETLLQGFVCGPFHRIKHGLIEMTFIYPIEIRIYQTDKVDAHKLWGKDELSKQSNTRSPTCALMVNISITVDLRTR